jgi:hypothetical protein
MNGCKFDEAWIGQCKKTVVCDTEYCEKHGSIKCCSCKAQASYTCDRTGALVCGAPLCDGCDGYETPGAGFGFMGFGGHGHGTKQWIAQRSKEAAQ